MHDTRVRMLKLAERLFTGGAVTSDYIRRTFNVSAATAKRDLVVLEASLPCLVVAIATGRGPAGRGCSFKQVSLPKPSSFTPHTRSAG